MPPGFSGSVFGGQDDYRSVLVVHDSPLYHGAGSRAVSVTRRRTDEDEWYHPEDLDVLACDGSKMGVRTSLLAAMGIGGRTPCDQCFGIGAVHYEDAFREGFGRLRRYQTPETVRVVAQYLKWLPESERAWAFSWRASERHWGVPGEQLRWLLKAAPEPPDLAWFTAALELNDLAEDVDGLFWNAELEAQGYEPWRSLPPGQLRDLSSGLIERSPDAADFLRQYVAAGDARRVRLAIDHAPQLETGLGLDVARQVLLDLLEANPHELWIWEALVRDHPFLKLVEATTLAARLLTTPVSDGSPQDGVLGGGPIESCLRLVLDRLELESNDGLTDSGWVVVDFGLGSAGAATRGRATDILVGQDSTTWPKKVAGSLRRASEVEPYPMLASRMREALGARNAVEDSQVRDESPADRPGDCEAGGAVYDVR